MSEFMYALYFKKFNRSFQEALEYKQVEKPKIKSPNDILVRVKAAGVNPAEPKFVSGNFPPTKLMVSLPCLLGADFSGVIEEKGSNVNDFEIGDEVYGMLPFPVGPNGAFAQYTVLDITKGAVAKKPSAMSFEQAASAGIALITAYTGLINYCGLEDSESRKDKKKILVVGASGGVGSFAIQLARVINPGNIVVGICSTKNTDYVKSLGADNVVNYDNESAYNSFITESKEQFDIVFDCVGGEEYHNQLDPLLTKKGIYSTAVGPIKGAGSENVTILQSLGLACKLAYNTMFGKHKYYFVNGIKFNVFRSDIAPLFESFQDIVKPENVVPLKDGYVTVFEKLMSHRVVGKIVFKIDEP